MVFWFCLVLIGRVGVSFLGSSDVIFWDGWGSVFGVVGCVLFGELGFGGKESLLRYE